MSYKLETPGYGGVAHLRGNPHPTNTSKLPITKELTHEKTTDHWRMQPIFSQKKHREKQSLRNYLKKRQSIFKS